MNEADFASARPLNQFLRMAVVAGVESAVQIHIARGDDLNARDAKGMTPLMLSAARNKPAICKLLLSAGVDHDLLDPSGKTALEIAIAAGSEATAAILDALSTPIASFPPSKIALDPEPKPAAEPSPSLVPIPAEATPAEPEQAAAPPESKAPAEPPAPEPTPVVFVDVMDDGEFDLSGWETEEEPTRPQADLVILDSASAVQATISSHEPIDSSVDWDDIDAFLPEVALPLARADDGEGRALLRRLLLRAIREGSVPSLDVQAQSTNEDRSANSEAEAYLTMVINDLGAEVDERIERSDIEGSFEVFVDPEETPDEEAALDEALGAIDRATSPWHEPLRIYQREFQRLRLLTADEEIQLGKEMEAALDAALNALASWPDGIARTLAAGAEAIAGSRQLSSIWVGSTHPDLEPAEGAHQEVDTPSVEVPEDAMDEDGERAEGAAEHVGDATFVDALQRLASLVEADETPRASPQEIHQALAALRLNRRFLLELIDAAHGSAPCPAFARAMLKFRKARDWMAAANLKLAFFNAKKYLYSGEPLDDLAQEGNIGLLKAVDRYDWRRGFRFSTYATWWIRQQISRHIADKARTVRMPVHIFEKVQRAERDAQAFEMAFGREPTIDELASRVEMPAKKVAALLRIAPEPLRIDDLSIDGLIAIDAREVLSPRDPADVVEEIQLRAAVERYISSLSTKDHKEELVLRLRFGIGIGEAMTLDEVGQRFGVTRERIRQIEAKAIRKLKHPVRSEPFARLVLGLEPKDNPLANGSHESEGIDGADVAEATRRQQESRRTADFQSQEESIQPLDSSVPAELNRALAQAAALGVNVDDDRVNSGHICVELLKTSGRSHHLLAHRLIVLGFDFWPGKGYWK